MLDVWPSGLFVPTAVGWRRSNAVSSSESVSGIRRATLTDGGGFWGLSLRAIPLWTPEAIRTMRAMAHRMDSGATPVIVDTCERAFAPLLVDGDPPRVPHSDGSSFSDGSLYVSGLIDIRVAAPAALRATELTVRVIAGRALGGGEAFSIYHGPPSGFEDGKRRYEIFRVTAPSDGVQTLSLWPPLRAAATKGQELDFERVGSAMNIINADAFFADIDLGRFSEASPVFQEAF